MPKVFWRPSVKLVLSDVDETIADVYTKASKPLINLLERLLASDVRLFLISADILNYLGLTTADIKTHAKLEIWGDKFSEARSKHDSLTSRSVDPRVRTLDFRIEDVGELPKGYNIVIWDGNKHLHNGLLEYLEGSAI